MLITPVSQRFARDTNAYPRKIEV